MRDNGRTGWRKPEGTRQQHQVRAYPHEWQLIKTFAEHVKHGDREKCLALLKLLVVSGE